MRSSKVYQSSIRVLLRTTLQFAKEQASSGGLLIVAAIAALLLANSKWAQPYHDALLTTLSIGFDEHVLSKSIEFWISDGLMAIFFLLVGLEIKREVLKGELRTPRLAAFPLASAIGGMLLPAFIYLLFNANTSASRGWGVPMATDIAFSLGILLLCGKRVPDSIRIALTALAIIDDIGAVIVIAIFYTSQINLEALGMAPFVVVLLAGLNVCGVRRLAPYLLLGTVLWFFMLASGVHATMAGVILALAIPATSSMSDDEFVSQGKSALQQMQTSSSDLLARNKSLHSIEVLHREVQAPLHRLEHQLAPWVAFGIMPLFAIANAGVALTIETMRTVTSPIALGIGLGLVVGKALGIFGFSWLVVKLGLAELPRGSNWRHILGLALLGGIGFTMSLFVARLAFISPSDLEAAKLGILAGSFAAALLGFFVLRIPAEKRSKR